MRFNKTILIADFICFIATIILFIYSFFEIQNISIVYDKVINNIFLQDFTPIQEIYIGRGECQVENTVPIFAYNFGGVDENCLENNTILNKTCPSSDSKYKQIPAISKRKMLIWRNKLLCAKYMTNKNGLFKIIRNSTDCGSGYHFCGKINEKKTHKTKIYEMVCIKDGNQCPINFIAITNDKEAIKKYKDSKTYDLKSIDSDYYLVTSNRLLSNNHSLILNITISEGKYPCLLENRVSIEKPFFPLMKNKNDYNCSLIAEEYDKSIEADINKGYDIRYKSFDKISKHTFLRENDIDLSYERLPNVSGWVNDMDNSSYNLFYRDSYIDKDNCKMFESFQEKIRTLFRIQFGRVVFNIVHMVLIVLFIGVLALIKVVIIWYHNLLFLVKIILCYIVFGANIFLVFHSQKKVKTVETIESLETCFDDVVKRIMQIYKVDKLMAQLGRFYYAEQFVWYAYAGANLILLVRLLHKMCVRAKNKKRRNIVYREIGKRQLWRIFDAVREMKGELIVQPYAEEPANERDEQLKKVDEEEDDD